MARLYTFGWETNSTSSGIEVPNRTTTSATLSSSIARSGVRSGRISSLVSATRSGWGGQFVDTLSNGPYSARFGFYPVTAPTAANMIFAFVAGASVAAVSANDGAIKYNADGSIALWANGSQIGSNSAALAAAAWSVIQIEYDNSPASGAKILRAWLNGSLFAGTTSGTNVGGTTNGFAIGGNLNAETQTQGEWHFDDLAINDDTGSHENGLPDVGGRVILLRPNAAGDSNAWLDTSAAAGTASNYTLVDDTIPNDATNLVQANGAGALDLYNLEPASSAGVGASDTVKLVQVYGRSRDAVADAVTAWAPVIIKASGGTQATGTPYVPNTTTWRTGALNSANQITPNGTWYTDPDGAAWTTANLDTAQLGPKITTGGTNRAQVSALWALVEYVPSSLTTLPGDVAAEADTAVTGTGRKLAAGTVAAELDTAITGTGRKAAAGGVAQQLDTAVTGASTKRAAGTVAAEADTAPSGTGAKTAAAGTVAAEADTAPPGAGRRTTTGAAALEADAAAAGVGAKTAAGTPAAEADTAVAGAGVLAVPGTAAGEADQAVAGAGTKTGTGTAAETDTAPSGAGLKSAVGAVTAQSDAAVAGLGRRVTAATPTAEVDTAVPGAGRAVMAGGLAGEACAALPGTGLKRAAGDPAAQADRAVPGTVPGLDTVQGTPARQTDAAVAGAGRKTAAGWSVAQVDQAVAGAGLRLTAGQTAGEEDRAVGAGLTMSPAVPGYAETATTTSAAYAGSTTTAATGGSTTSGVRIR